MTRRLATALLLLGFLTAGLSCGKKGPPFVPPKEAFDARVSDLQGEWSGGYALLRGKITATREERARLEGCRVAIGIYPASDPPCDGCPIEFRDQTEFGRESLGDGALFCRVSAGEKGQIYFFRVSLVGPKGILGPPSNAVRVEAE